ncbi:MAG: ABC transporter permease [Cyanobacteria bacterium P01_F01_bin.42]
MDLLENVKMASATLASNRLRSALTMLGMIIGNASVIAMVGVGEGTSRYASSQFESLGPNVLFVVPGNDEVRNRTFDIPRNLVLADADAIATQVPTVSQVSPQLQNQLTVTYRSKTTSSLVVGATETFPEVRDFDVNRGRFISKVDDQRGATVAAIGTELAQNLFGSEDPVGKQVRIKNLSFQIVGLMESKGAFLGNNQDDVIFVPLSVMANRLQGDTSPFGTELTFISATATDEDSIQAASFQIANLLRLRHKVVDEDDFTIRTQKQAIEIIGAVTGALTIMLSAIAGISLLVGGIGIMNIMLVSVTERIQEIGLRKAIGASKNDILLQFMIESIILSAAGGTIGTVIGVGGVLLVGVLTPLEAGISIPAILLAVTVSGSIGLFFGVVPARRAAGLDPIVALRST